MSIYKSERLDNYKQKSIWIIEIFKNFRKREDKNPFYKNEWIEFHPYKYGGRLTLEKAGYFDERPQLIFYLSNLLFIPLLILTIFYFSWYLVLLTIFSILFGVGEIFLNLPIKTGINECESPEWGFYFYSHAGFEGVEFVICLGKKSKHISMPWNLEWYRTSYLLRQKSKFSSKDFDRWANEFKGDRQDFWDSEKWGNILWKEIHPYIYILNSGEVQERQAAITLVEREWRRKWLMWTNLFNKVVRVIDIQFNEEIGEGVGSWKGGTIGCSYEMKQGETPLDCLKRMEIVRKFER